METVFSRRRFLATSSGAAAGLVFGLWPSGCRRQAPRQYFRKAVIIEKPAEKALSSVREAGFDGVEAGIVTSAEARKVRTIAESLGLRIHSVLRGWAKFNSTQADEVEKSLAVTIDALYAAEGYGAGVVLLVPGRIDISPIPDPWEFRIEFDNETGHLTRVVEQDNHRYGDYIAAHNRAYDACRASIEQLIPTAEKTGVVIAVENVWNNMFVAPDHAAHFIDSFGSPFVRAYFDIGNHVKYNRPEKWISVLAERIVRCHVKDFKLNADGRGGRFVHPGEGSVNWPIVMRTLKDVGYQGWLTIEGSEKLSLRQKSRRLDRIIVENSNL